MKIKCFNYNIDNKMHKVFIKTTQDIKNKGTKANMNKSIHIQMINITNKCLYKKKHKCNGLTKVKFEQTT